MPKRHRATPSAAFERLMGRRPQRVHPFTVPIDKPRGRLDPGALYHYWHPDRDGVEPAPPDVQARLLEIAGRDEQGRPKLACVRPPAGAPIRCRCWLVFYRKREVTHYLSPGWLLILAWHNGREPHPEPLPIDNRLYANLTLQSLGAGRAIVGRDFDNARQYFDHVASVVLRDREKHEIANAAYLADRRRDFWDHTKIKNIGHGSKFALHHDGTIVPSRGEANWLRERPLPLPKDVADRVHAEQRRPSRVAMLQKDAHAVAVAAFDRDLHLARVKAEIRELAKARRRQTVAVRRRPESGVS